MMVTRQQKSPCRVFVVEDHAVMRQVLREAVERQPECEFAGAAASAEDALAAIDQAPIDLVLVDVSLPKMSGLEFVRMLSQRSPELACLMVSGHVDPGYAKQALEAGACGYVIKGRPDDLAAGIRAAITGFQYLSEPLEEEASTDGPLSPGA